VTEAIFGLIGVIVGALLSGLLEAFREGARVRAEARAAALVITEELIRSSAALLTVRNRRSWKVLRASPWLGSRDRWDESKGLLARRLTLLSLWPRGWTMDGWTTTSSAYGGIDAVVATIPDPDESDSIDDDAGRHIARTYLLAMMALSHLTILTHMPRWWRLFARVKFVRQHRRHIAKNEKDEHKLRRELDDL
jgi:hypothetical protein